MQHGDGQPLITHCVRGTIGKEAIGRVRDPVPADAAVTSLSDAPSCGRTSSRPGLFTPTPFRKTAEPSQTGPSIASAKRYCMCSPIQSAHTEWLGWTESRMPKLMTTSRLYGLVPIWCSPTAAAKRAAGNREESMGAKVTLPTFKQRLAGGHIYQSVYHFTDAKNIPSIAQHGILSKKEASRRGIVVAMRGGNQWSNDADIMKGLEDYVNLCFTMSHPMCHIAHMDGRIPNPLYLPISADVLEIPGVKITLAVANKSGTKLLDVEDGLSQLDLDVLYTRTNWSDPAIQARLTASEKCEILVPKVVPVELIKRKL
jgi:hypothetical protein